MPFHLEQSGGAMSHCERERGDQRRECDAAVPAASTGPAPRTCRRREGEHERRLHRPTEHGQHPDRQQRSQCTTTQIRRVHERCTGREGLDHDGLEGADGRERRQDQQQPERPVARERQHHQSDECDEHRRRHADQGCVRDGFRAHSTPQPPRRREPTQADAEHRQGHDRETDVILQERGANARQRDLEGECGGRHQTDAPCGAGELHRRTIRD